MVCEKPARMMAEAPVRRYPDRRECCGIGYYPHYPRTIPVERSYRERVDPMPREATR